MASGDGIILFIILVISLAYVDARNLATDNVIVTAYQGVPREGLERNEQLCTLCEEYTALAADYLNANKTETEIIDTLHKACSQLHAYEQQCVILVDYYSSLFFSEISKIRPDEFCTKMNLCEKRSFYLSKKDEACMLCRHVIDEILTKLKDPDSQLEIIQTLLKECNVMEQYAQQCKRLVFRYAPLILVNGQKFIESNDICADIHACAAKQEDFESEVLAKSLLLGA